MRKIKFSGNRVLFIGIAAAIMSVYYYFHRSPGVYVIQDLSNPPVSTFKRRCAVCHGSEGASFGQNIGKMNDEVLRSNIEGMMNNEAGLHADSLSIEAMAAYIRTFLGKKPFAAVINARSFMASRDSSLFLDLTPGSTLSIKRMGVKVEQLENLWRVSYNPSKIRIVKFFVTRSDVASPLVFPEELWVR
jgi:hypothetical protein